MRLISCAGPHLGESGARLARLRAARSVCRRAGAGGGGGAGAAPAAPLPVPLPARDVAVLAEGVAAHTLEWTPDGVVVDGALYRVEKMVFIAKRGAGE